MAGTGTKRALQFLLLVVLGMAPLLAVYSPQLFKSSLPLQVVFAPSYIAWVAKLLYDHWTWFYFATTRAWLRFTRSSVQWSMSVDLDATSDGAVISMVASDIIGSCPGATRWQVAPLEQVVKLPWGGAVKVYQTATFGRDEGHQLSLDFDDLHVLFGQSDRALDSIIAMLERVMDIVHPRGQSFTFRVHFGGVNPYFGLFVRQLRVPNQQLKAFICEFVEKVGPQQERVQVSERVVTITASSVAGLQSLSRRYVTLAAIDLTNL